MALSYLSALIKITIKILNDDKPIYCDSQFSFEHCTNYSDVYTILTDKYDKVDCFQLPPFLLISNISYLQIFQYYYLQVTSNLKYEIGSNAYKIGRKACVILCMFYLTCYGLLAVLHHWFYEQYNFIKLEIMQIYGYESGCYNIYSRVG